MELATIQPVVVESVEEWLEAVHAGYGSSFGEVFRDCGYTTLDELRGASTEEVEILRGALSKAGAKKPQLRLIEGAMVDLSAPAALPTAQVVGLPMPSASGPVVSSGGEVVLASSEALQIPVATVVAGQTAGLERVYVGMGWRERDTSRGDVDVDCSATGFSGGRRLEEHTVSFVRLHNAGDAPPATIVHTGDILVGQRSRGAAYDLERIYLDLANLPAIVDSLAFEANVYTPNVNFDALANAYVRLVNADTNQELGRCPLDTLGDRRCLLFARLFRVKARGDGVEWRLVAALELGDKLMRHDAAFQPSMIFEQPRRGRDKKTKKSTTAVKTYAPPRIELATAAGVAAAIAIFANPSNLSAANFEPSLFEAGVGMDGALEAAADLAAWGPISCGDCLADCGRGLSDAAANVCECLGDCAISVGQCIGDCVMSTGDCLYECCRVTFDVLCCPLSLLGGGA